LHILFSFSTMLSPSLPDPELLKTLLEPLLDDFKYWLGRSQTLLLNEHIEFLSVHDRTNLLVRVQQALQEVSASQSLFHATNGQAGIDTAMVIGWHKLVAECWQVMIRFRLGETHASEKLEGGTD
jgi:Protein of unknown function (DUF2605)